MEVERHDILKPLQPLQNLRSGARALEERPHREGGRPSNPDGASPIPSTMKQSETAILELVKCIESSARIFL
jgi:hypothetical protein